MQRIALKKTAPGMVLAQAVKAQEEGPVLVGAGITLTEAIIGRIRQAGVGTVWVEGNPLGGQGTVGDLRAVLEKLPFLFRRHKDNVFMMTLCAVLSRHFSKRMAEQRAVEDTAIEAGKKSGQKENNGTSAGNAP